MARGQAGGVGRRGWRRTRGRAPGPHMVHCPTVRLPLGALLIWRTMCGYRRAYALPLAGRRRRRAVGVRPRTVGPARPQDLLPSLRAAARLDPRKAPRVRRGVSERARHPHRGGGVRRAAHGGTALDGQRLRLGRERAWTGGQQSSQVHISAPATCREVPTDSQLPPWQVGNGERAGVHTPSMVARPAELRFSVLRRLAVGPSSVAAWT